MTHVFFFIVPKLFLFFSPMFVTVFFLLMNAEAQIKNLI
jgi:hypothetical protein